MAGPSDYPRATRHPWPCLLFIVPFLLVYELGVLHYGGSQPEILRNGADTWVREGLTRVGMRQHFCAPILLLSIMLLWNVWRRHDRPGDLIGVLCGMGVESVAFALGLWGISRGLGPLIDALGLELSVGNRALGQLITFIGAGIYEELLFRLLLLSALLLVCRGVGLSDLLSIGLSVLLSAFLFSAAHHIGPHGEPLEGYTFFFRTLAGLYFAFLYLGRGFGIAVGAHACYDVIVGITV